MPNRLADALSPYLRSHAGNPVDWWPWSAEAFAEARRRDVPVLISIGYATCHWCHVMARETFSDPQIAALINERFVAIKVDREEHPQVDAAYLAAAGAFTDQLGWPLTIFAIPDGRTFHAATYLPPRAHPGLPSFRDVADAVHEAWTERRDGVEQQADALTTALAQQAEAPLGGTAGAGVVEVPATASESALPHPDALTASIDRLLLREDLEHGGFGSAPKFPIAPVLQLLLDHGSALGRRLASRTLVRIIRSPLFDPVDGGFFRYATRADWSVPHYERMLYDNAQLLRVAAVTAALGDSGHDSVTPDAADEARRAAEGVARFLAGTMRVTGGFASGQDSESTIDGQRVEGGYYEAAPAVRASLDPPPLDRKVLTGWNGLAIEALAEAGFRLRRPEWTQLAADVADELWLAHADGRERLVRVSLDAVASDAVATLEDYGCFANGLLALAETTGEVRFAIRARALVRACLAPPDAPDPFTVPGGGDPVLTALALPAVSDPSEGALPSGRAAVALAALRLHRLTDDDRYREAAVRWIAAAAPLALAEPLAFGGTLQAVCAAIAPVRQLLVITDPLVERDALVDVARGTAVAGATLAVATAAQAEDLAAEGFELYADRARVAAYLCENFVCRLPLTDPDDLERALA